MGVVRKIEPHVQAQLLGCEFTVSDSRVSGNVIRHRVCLARNGVPVACRVVARNNAYRVSEVEQRIREGLIAPSSDMYGALCELADVAVELFGGAQ